MRAQRAWQSHSACKDVPNDWTCPVCGASKDNFTKEEQKIGEQRYRDLWI
ncbi:rubredoxin [Candidatus Bathyarchaeota archaeon]|nr:rubredoxin [Candidatus Bathyarchaeota archaeon]